MGKKQEPKTPKYTDHQVKAARIRLGGTKVLQQSATPWDIMDAMKKAARERIVNMMLAFGAWHIPEDLGTASPEYLVETAKSIEHAPDNDCAQVTLNSDGSWSAFAMTWKGQVKILASNVPAEKAARAVHKWHVKGR